MRRLLILIVLIVLASLLFGCSSTQAYTVRAGDTLQSIALANNTTVSALIQLNQERYPSLAVNAKSLQPGWELDIPGEGDVGVAFESLLLRIARSTNPPSTPEPALPAAPNEKINASVQRVFVGINQVRQGHNLVPLTPDLNLTNIAQRRSNDMITRSYFSHTDPSNGQVLFQDLLRAQNYTFLFAGENIAEIRNQGSLVPTSFTVYERYTADELADQFVTGWMNSLEHYENIVNAHFRRTGIAIGVALDGTRIVATQVFSD